MGHTKMAIGHVLDLRWRDLMAPS